MNDRVTIYDMAKKLGVSTTIVNRAINGKPKVGRETRQLVLETAKAMGYKPNKVAVGLARKTIKIGVLITKTIHKFNDEVVQGAQKACEELLDYNVQGDFQIVSLSSCNEIINKMQQMGENGINGIIVCPSNDLRGYDQLIENLYDKGIPVATVISDIPETKRLFSVRNNGVASGRIAAELLWLHAKDSPVAIFTALKGHGIHKENIDGFMEFQKEKPLNLIGIYENHDDPNIAYHLTDKLIKEYPDIGGLYISTQNSSTVCQRILESGLGGKIKVVASDVFPELVEYLRKGIVHATIFQDPFNQGRLVFKYLYEHIAEGKNFNSDILLKPQIVLPSNIDLFINDK